MRDTVNLEGALTRLDCFNIEVPSWGFANTGTRFGKFLQPGAATTLEEKFADAAQVLALRASRRHLHYTCCGIFPAV